MVAKAMKRLIRANDFVGRYGGEEFFVVCVEADMDEAFRIAERIRSVIERLRIKNKNEDVVKFTVSLGIAQYDGSETFDELVKRADDALYKAKGRGRNRICKADKN